MLLFLSESMAKVRAFSASSLVPYMPEPIEGVLETPVGQKYMLPVLCCISMYMVKNSGGASGFILSLLQYVHRRCLYEQWFVGRWADWLPIVHSFRLEHYGKWSGTNDPQSVHHPCLHNQP